ncbi:hypothetical protein PS046_04905 [Escherichia albertii]|nr:hypothetical protein [Escherichia albertii]WDC02971.1 hypothetical protein PS046_04905 [Escherichia albertii]
MSGDSGGQSSGKTTLPIHISVLAVYEQDINPEIKINDIKRFIVNSFASVKYDNISVVLSKRRDIIAQAPTIEIKKPIISPDTNITKALLVLLAFIIICCAIWKYKSTITGFLRLKK